MISARSYLWSVNTLGAGIVLSSLTSLLWTPVDPTWLLLAALALVSGATVLRFPFVSASFSVGDAFSFAALFLYGVEAATLTVALDALAISLRLKGSAVRTIFNVAAPCLAMWCAGVVLFWVLDLPLLVHTDSLWLGLVTTALAVGVMFAVGTALVAGAIATHEGASARDIWRRHFAQYWANPAACGYVGALVAVSARYFGPTALIAVVPIPLILYLAFRTALGRMNDQMSHLDELSRMHQSTIEAFATAVDAKDQVTHGHIRRVQTVSLALARDLGADAGTLKALDAAALLHDVGKIGIPEHILNKPGPLTPPEFEQMKRHVEIGADILSTIEFPFPVVPVVKHHHENWDGTGYPAGVRGEDIPLGARILSVVDCFDALISDRPYRAAMSQPAAFDILRARSGSMYDPSIVDRFIRLYPKLSVAGGAERAGIEVRPLPISIQQPMAIGSGSNDVTDAVLRMLAAVLPADLCVAYRKDARSANVVATAAIGPDIANIPGHTVPLGHGVSGWVASTETSIYESEAVLDFPGLAREHPLNAHRCSSIALPIHPPVVITVYGPVENGGERVRILDHLANVVSRLTSGASNGDPKSPTTVPS